MAGLAHSTCDLPASRSPATVADGADGPAVLPASGWRLGRLPHRTRLQGCLLGLGFAGGLPYALLNDPLKAWFGQMRAGEAAIGLLSLLLLPYAFKVCWSPLIDRCSAPWLARLGRRRSWLAAMQLICGAALVAVGLSGWLIADHPQLAVLVLGLLGLAAICSATQDLAGDAYRTDSLPPTERGVGAAMWVGGYRLAMLSAGAGAMILGGVAGYPVVFIGFGLVLAGLAVVSLLAPVEPASQAPSSLRAAVVEPLRQLFGLRGSLLLVVFVLIYQLPDRLAGGMTVTFLQRCGYEDAIIGTVRQTLGLAVTLLAVLLGGLLLRRYSLLACLLVFGLLQAVSNAGFLVLAHAGGSVWALAMVVVVENASAGLVTAAFVALLMSWCDRRFSVTQYALLSSLMVLAASLAGALSGFLAVELARGAEGAVGPGLLDPRAWTGFFGWSIAAGLPGLALLVIAGRRLTAGNPRAGAAEPASA